MNCSGCGFEVQSGFAFCPKCGAKQAAACTGCGYLCAPDFAFCPQCGAPVGAAPQSRNHHNHKAQIRAPPLAPPQEPALRPVETRQTTQADRRPVTILFADLSGFTTLSERLDPEDVQSLQNQLLEEMTTAGEGFGGFVGKGGG